MYIIVTIIACMAVERTFLAVKPLAFGRGDSVGIVKMLVEKLGAKCVSMKVYTASKELAEEHYSEHKEKPFFGSLVESFTSGPLLGMIWEGEGVVAKAREVMGATNPADSTEGTIRNVFGKSLDDNAIHGSDTEPGSADREVGLHFSEGNFSEIADPVAKAGELTAAAV